MIALVAEHKTHVVLDAIPGAGKSTLALNLVLSCAARDQVLMISYNRSLADETRAKLERLPQAARGAAQIFTFHGLLSSLTEKVVSSDVDLHTELGELERTRSAPLAWKHSAFSVLVLDEVQDLRPDFFRLVRFLVDRVCTRRAELRVLMVGDVRQLLYSFYPYSGADPRYMSLAPELFAGVNSLPWARASLSVTFRCPAPVCSFVSAYARLCQDPVAFRPPTAPAPAAGAAPPRALPPVQLLVCDVYRDAGTLLAADLARETAAGRSVLVLSSSMNARSPAVSLGNLLVRAGVRTRVVRSGDLSESNTSRAPPPAPGEGAAGPPGPGGDGAEEEGEATLRTFHTAKGLEGDVVVVFHLGPLLTAGLDPAFFVALTRARYRLVLVQDFRGTSLEELEEVAAELAEGQADVVVYREPAELRAAPPQPGGAQRPRRADRPQVLPVRSVFSFLDVECTQVLRQFLASDELQPAKFPVGDLYRPPADDVAAGDENKGSDSDSYFFVQQLTVDLRGTQHSFVGTCCTAIRHAVALVFGPGGVPADLYSDISAARGAIDQRKLPAPAAGGAGAAGGCADPFGVRARLARAVGAVSAAAAACSAATGAALSDRIEAVTGVLPDLVEVLTLVGSAAGFEDRVPVRDYSFAVHSSVFRRVDFACRAFGQLVRGGPGAFNRTRSAAAGGGSFRSTCFWVADDASRLVQLTSSPKTGPELLLGALLDACVHGCAEAALLNVFEGSVTTVRLAPGRSAAEFLLGTWNLRSVPKRERSEGEFLASRGRARDPGLDLFPNGAPGR